MKTPMHTANPVLPKLGAFNSARQRMRLLTISAVIMGFISIAVVLSTLWTEYATSLEQQRNLLVDIAKSNARLIEAVNRFDLQHSQLDHPEGALGATLSQIQDAYTRLDGLGRTGEFALARLNNGMIEFLIDQRYANSIDAISVPMASDLAEPMRQALLGHSGTIIGLDYRGGKVLAAFEPVQGTGMGIVAKIDYNEIQAPHIRAGLIALGVGLVISLGGIGLLYRYVNPLVHEINQTSDRFRDFADAASDWYWETDEKFVISYVSERYLELLGKSRSAVIGRPMRNIMGKMANEYAAVSVGTDGVPKMGEQSTLGWKSMTTMLDHAGNEHFVTISGKPYFNDDGMILGYRGTGTDITHQIQAERSLRAFKSTLDRTLDCVFMFSPDTLKFTYANQGAIEQVGYTFKELLNMTPVDLTPEFSEQILREILAPMISGEETAETFETLQCSKSGTKTPVEVFLQYVNPEKEEPTFIAIVRDITERRRTEEERATIEKALNESQKMEALGHLSGGMAHEFNNMLVPMIGLTELTMDCLPEGSIERQNLETALDAALRARELINQILMFARSEGRSNEPTELASIIEQSVKLLRASLPPRIHLEHDLSEGRGVKVVCDPTEINQILMNLGKNAADAIGDDEGNLRIKMSIVDLNDARAARVERVVPGKYVKIIAADDGCGMSRETQAHIFSPFYTTKEVGQGTGMGLSVVHGIISNYEGAIHVISSPGNGAVFEILLPIHKSEDIVVSSFDEHDAVLQHQP